MVVTDLKRSSFLNTSCFSNLYLFECLRKYKFKSYLNSLMINIGQDLSLAKKKPDCLKMKIYKGVRLRKVKVKGVAHIRQLRESTIPIDLSSKHEVCFMMKSTIKVMDTCLWYLDSGCSRHMTGDQSLFKVFESKKGGNATFCDGSKSQIKGKGIISLPGLPDIANVLYVEGLRVNLLSISQICDQDFMVLFSKGKCLVMNDVWTLVPRPKGEHIIGTKWIFRNKTDEEGDVIRNRARLVAQGYSQMERVDYDETFAPIACMGSIRILLVLACQLKFKLY